MEQGSIPTSIPRLEDTFSLSEPLFQLLSLNGVGLITDPTLHYRLTLVAIEILHYVKEKKLFSYPSTIICDEHLTAALGIRQFQIFQICDVVYMCSTIKQTPRYPLHVEFLKQSSERVALMKIIFEIAQDASQRYLF